MENNNTKLLDISWASVLKIALIFLVIYLLFLLRDVLVLILFALVFSVLFNPAIEFLQKIRLPRVLASGLVYLLVFGIFGLSVYLLSLPLANEVKQFASFFTQYFEKLSPSLRSLGFAFFENFESFMQSFETWLRDASANILSGLSAVFGGLSATLIIFFLSFFFSLEENIAERFIRIFFPKKYEEFALIHWQKAQQKITGWFSARLLCCLFVAIASFFVLKLFKINYAFSLSLFAGITNIIPYLGPIVAGFFMTVVVILEDWLKAIFILVAFLLIQQIESSLLSPFLLKRIIGLPPALVLISLIVGAKLFGFLGVLLGIPLGGILYEFIVDFLEKRRKQEEIVVL
ncbi:MAG: AI-2E family transporter [Minisyncoccales bacterium]